MTRYFFNLTGDPEKPDDEGIELENNAAPKKHGLMCVGQLMRDDQHALVAGKDIDLEIADERGLVLNVSVTKATAGSRAS